MIYHFYAPCYVEYSSINKMAKYDWNTFRNYVAFLAGGVAPGTRRPHHDSELISCYHDAFRTWGNYHNNIVLFYHDSPITRSHFMDPTDRAIKGFCCNYKEFLLVHPYFSLVLTLFHRSRTEDWQVSRSLPIPCPRMIPEHSCSKLHSHWTEF